MSATTVASERPLAGLQVGISVSEPEGNSLLARGLRAEDLNDITVDLCRRIVSLGGRIVLGQQWRPGGVMEAVASFAQAYQSESDQPIIRNILAYPDKAPLSPGERQTLSRVIAIEDSDTREVEPRPDSLRRAREKIAEMVQAQICLGGRMAVFEGLLPGLVEEMHLVLSRGNPIYVSAMLGGAAEFIADFLRSGRPQRLERAHSTLGVEAMRPGDQVLVRRVLADLDEWTLPRLAETCRLTMIELDELFSAQNVDTVLHVATRGLARQHRTGRG